MKAEKRSDITVLIVDDNKSVGETLGHCMRGEGYSVCLAVDGSSAWETIQDSQPDIVITDIKMPGLDGFQLLKLIESQYPGIGVVVITPHGDNYSVKEAMLHGADEYICRPFEPIEIGLIVERAYWSARNKKRRVTTGKQ